jgi:hypothetical protein
MYRHDLVIRDRSSCRRYCPVKPVNSWSVIVLCVCFGNESTDRRKEWNKLKNEHDCGVTYICFGSAVPAMHFFYYMYTTERLFWRGTIIEAVAQWSCLCIFPVHNFMGRWIWSNFLYVKYLCTYCIKGCVHYTLYIMIEHSGVVYHLSLSALIHVVFLRSLSHVVLRF